MADVNYQSIADNTAPVVVDSFVPPANPLAYDDILKLSHATDVTIRNVTIPGGKEDVLDMNRDCVNILVQNVEVQPNGKYGFTIKGGTHNVVLQDVVFRSHGKTYDIDLGNWSEQSKGKTEAVILNNVITSDGSPVRVRVLHAEKPHVIGGNVKLTVYPSWLVSIIRFFRGLF